MSITRQCPRCGTKTQRVSCCGERLPDGWHMNPRAWSALRHLAFNRKGLDGDTFRLQLHAVGALKAKSLTLLQFNDLVARLNQLPDRPGYTEDQAHVAQRQAA